MLCRCMPSDAPAITEQLFAMLHGFDAQNVMLIWIENPSATSESDGVCGRLGQAGAGWD